MNLDIIVFGDVTLRQCLYGIVAFIMLVILYRGVKRLLFKPKEYLHHHIAFTCDNCGWTGQIGKYAGRCPMCNQPTD